MKTILTIKELEGYGSYVLVGPDGRHEILTPDNASEEVINLVYRLVAIWEDKE